MLTDPLLVTPGPLELSLPLLQCMCLGILFGKMLFQVTATSHGKAAGCHCHSSVLGFSWGWAGCALPAVVCEVPTLSSCTPKRHRGHSQDLRQNLLFPDTTATSPRELKGCKHRPGTSLRAGGHLVRVLEQGTFKASRHLFCRVFPL